MNDKSHVGMESKTCILCDSEYETGAILLDRRLRESLERLNNTGPGLCNSCKEEHTGLPLDEYDHVALIEGSNPVYEYDSRMRKRLTSCDTTGKVCFMRKGCYDDMFDVDLGEWEFCIVEPDVMNWLEQLQVEATNAAE